MDDHCHLPHFAVALQAPKIETKFRGIQKKGIIMQVYSSAAASLSGKNSENFTVCYVLSSHCTFVVRYLEFYLTRVMGIQIGKEGKNFMDIATSSALINKVIIEIKT